ncbi:carboxylesterase 4A [Pectinophora gossypiella]|nr:carboxylesterase 4A [Pectinophora gossypiella]
MWRWWCLLVVLVVVWSAPAEAVVGGQPAAPPEPDAAVVFVQKHGLSARLEGLKDERLGYYSFFGIRYAEPPVGQRRFQRPVRRYLGGDVAAKLGCMPCPQPNPRNPNMIIGHEDCLCVNVFAPKMPGEEQGSPVVFFIHGGNYRGGSSSPYGGQHLTQKDTILVTAQYRLGSLGYFSTAERDASGNAGLFDLRSAMIWIKDYIEFFGGDPTRVVVMGQGSGGSAASLMALSNEGRSATGVAALSGAPLSPGAVKPDPAKYAKELAKRTGCPDDPAERLIRCLRELPMEKIVKADSEMSMDNVDTKQFLDEISGRSGNGARVEGEDDLRALPPLVAEAPAESLAKKKQRVPLLTGVTSAETSRAVFGKYNKFLTTQLTEVKDFIKQELIAGLKDVVTGVRGLVAIPAETLKQVLPLPDYYQAVFDSSLNAIDGLDEIAEATGDALFNFPAYQSVREWSAGADSPAYLYSFEHLGNLTRGSHFVPGLALTSELDDAKMEGKTAKGPAHGDELAYIFEPLDDQGKSLGGEVSSTDARVRENFVGLIAKFAHDLSPMEKNNKSGTLNLMPFSKNNDQFIKIKDEITLDKDFRFCQMGLWGNMADRVTGALCKNVIGNLLKLPKLPVPLPVTPKVPILPNVIGGLVSNNQDSPKEVFQVTRRPTNAPKRPGLGGLLNGL